MIVSYLIGYHSKHLLWVFITVTLSEYTLLNCSFEYTLFELMFWLRIIRDENILYFPLLSGDQADKVAENSVLPPFQITYWSSPLSY